MTMYTYSFSGIIHPERVNFGLDRPIQIAINHPFFDLVGRSAISFDSSKISVEFISEFDYTKNPKCNLETLKNFIDESVRIIVDSYCYIKSYAYDVEISTVKCTELGIDYTFGVQGEYNVVKTIDKTNLELSTLIGIFQKPDSTFLKDVFADFRRAIKYPAMTASFCFRAIETIRIFCFEDPSNVDDYKRRKDGWFNLRGTFALKEEDFEEIKRFALANRHGEYPAITYTQRERIMNFTRSIIEKTISRLR
jgi:hypothetical protein